MKNTNKKDCTFIIPHLLMKDFEIGRNTEISVNLSDKILLATKEEKTAKDIFEIIEILSDYSVKLLASLAASCGSCEEDGCFCCDEYSPEDFEDVPPVIISAFLNEGYCLSTLQDLIDSDEVINMIDEVD